MLAAIPETNASISPSIGIRSPLKSRQLSMMDRQSTMKGSDGGMSPSRALAGASPKKGSAMDVNHTRYHTTSIVSATQDDDTQSRRSSSMNYDALLRPAENEEQMKNQLALLKQIIDETIDVHEMFN